MSSLSLPGESFDKLNLHVSLQVEVTYLNSVYCMFFCPTFYVGWFGNLLLWEVLLRGSGKDSNKMGQLSSERTESLPDTVFCCLLFHFGFALICFLASCHKEWGSWWPWIPTRPPLAGSGCIFHEIGMNSWFFFFPGRWGKASSVTSHRSIQQPCCGFLDNLRLNSLACFRPRKVRCRDF